MTKLEELKAAYEVAVASDYIACEEGNGIPGEVLDFADLAASLMPQLLEAVDLLETLRYSMSQYDDGEWFLHEGGEDVVGKVDEFLEKLK